MNALDMTSTAPDYRPHHLIRNRTSLVGLVIACLGITTASLFLIVDILAEFENPYLNIFTYLMAPGVAVFGIVLTLTGAVRMRRRLRKDPDYALQRLPVIDFNNHAHLRLLILSLVGGVIFLALSSVGAYRAYHFSESVEFCGLTCHSVMKPEHTAYQSSPHANVSCTACHIGPGANWFVRSKLDGLRQVYNTAFDRYDRPIQTPIHNLRPAKETCHTCHWPEKFFGAVLVERTYFRSDSRNNDPWTIRMLVHVGGGDSRHGRGQGIHWHMAVDNTVEYVAADERRLEIPWVRQVKSDGEEIIYRSTARRHKDFLEHLATPEGWAAADVREMDCMDCHNRPSHQFHSPERAMNESMRAGLIDPTLARIKSTAVNLLNGTYATEEEALTAIETGLRKQFPEPDARVAAAIGQIQRIYRENFFPEMGVNWRAYPDHIGHWISPGCFRCHDGNMVSDTGRTITSDCNACHTLLAQGPGLALDTISARGLEFEHPEDIDDEWKTQRCNDCHDGMPIF